MKRSVLVGWLCAIVGAAAWHAVAVAAAAYGTIRGVDLHALVQKGIETSINQTAGLYEKGGFKGEELQSLQQGMRQAGVLAAADPAAATLPFVLSAEPETLRADDHGMHRRLGALEHAVILGDLLVEAREVVAVGAAALRGGSQLLLELQAADLLLARLRQRKRSASNKGRAAERKRHEPASAGRQHERRTHEPKIAINPHDLVPLPGSP